MVAQNLINMTEIFINGKRVKDFTERGLDPEGLTLIKSNSLCM